MKIVLDVKYKDDVYYIKDTVINKPYKNNKDVV